MKSTEKVTDWNSIYNQMFQKRAVERFNYDCTHGIEAFDRREKEKLEELHQFFVNIEKESDDTILIGELAKILKGKGIQIGQNRLFQWLRDNGYLISRRGSDRNMPTQRSMELDLFQIKETVINHSDGNPSIKKTPKVTGIGQQYFIDKFMNREEQVEA